MTETNVDSNARQQQQSLLRTGSSNVSRTSLLSTVLSLIAILLRLLLTPLKILSRFIFPSHEYDGLQTADKAARTFSQTHSTFGYETMGYQKCVSEGHTRNQFLFIYLHSSLHPQSKRFVSTILNNADAPSQNAMSECIKFGGDIHKSAEAYKLSRDFHVAFYPFCALCVCRSSTTVEVIWRMDGYMPDFYSKIGAAIGNYNQILREEERRRRRREEEARLRQEQDREFQETLLEDQRREAARRAEEEQARQAQLQAQLESQLALERQQSRMSSAKELIESNPEPSPSTPHIARLRMMFPSGRRVERRFHQTCKIEVIKAFVIVYMEENNIEIPNFELEMNYPKKKLDNVELTIEEVGLGSMAVLMVRDLDA